MVERMSYADTDAVGPTHTIAMLNFFAGTESADRDIELAFRDVMLNYERSYTVYIYEQWLR